LGSQTLLLRTPSAFGFTAGAYQVAKWPKHAQVVLSLTPNTPPAVPGLVAFQNFHGVVLTVSLVVRSFG
jgi:hypothetical protein